jgi:hypothetical protein
VFWGPQAFENSSAERWVDGLDERRIDAQVREALGLAEPTRPLLLHEAVAVVCAAEMLAARHGEPSTPLPDRVRRLLVLSPRPTPHELALARRGLQRVREASALRALRDERGELEGWLGALHALEARLSG